MVRRSQGDCYSDVKEAFFSFLLFSVLLVGEERAHAAAGGRRALGHNIDIERRQQ